MSFLQVLPLAIVMIAGPQILSAVFLATSDQWRRNSAAFVLGAAVSISTVVVLGYVFVDGAVGQRASRGTLDTAIVVLLLAAMAHTLLTRAESAPPTWMGTLTDASPGFSFRLGFLLLGVFPTDILTSVTVGSYLAARGSPVTDAAGFVALTLLLLALPSLAVLALGERAATALPRMREWMTTNSWVINEFVLAFFVVVLLTG